MDAVDGENMERARIVRVLEEEKSNALRHAHGVYEQSMATEAASYLTYARSLQHLIDRIVGHIDG